MLSTLKDERPIRPVDLAITEAVRVLELAVPATLRARL